MNDLSLPFFRQRASSPRLPEYRYSELLNKKLDIRLVTLLPGKYDDDIKFRISHVPSLKRADRPSALMSLKELQESLPPGYTAYETVEGMYFFGHDEMEETSRWHPVQDFD
ncbi:hypothetical protein B0O99DRAFT_522226 [Bisporella sp. PMI_857]|nr:hypothetical protein B0O99DRAFT_522226 [Bisporella sp. PMI_857]